MVHNKGLVVCLKVDGKVLKENHETVYVPFDNEYVIHLKNLKPQQAALVNVFVDGEAAIKGLIVPAGGYVDLERFHDGKNAKGRKFMFVEKDAAVEARRDNRVEDGLVRVEYQFEEYPPYTWAVRTAEFNPLRGDSDTYYGYSSNGTGRAYKGSGASITCNAFASAASASDYTVARSISASTNDAGITERGSVSNQKFVAGYIGVLEREKHVMSLSMKGFREEEQLLPVWRKDVAKPKFKTPFCSNCGLKARIGDNFCSCCGKKLK